MRYKAIIFLSLTVVFLNFAQAQSYSENFINYDELMTAKLKKYPGGIDEEELKVQIQLLIPVSKMVELSTSNEPEEANSSD